METLEQLERRKKELELKRDIARLERQGRMLPDFDPALIWAVPTIAIVSFTVFIVVDNNGIKTIPSAIIGLLCAGALYAAFRFVRKSRRGTGSGD